jgi:hypothetical protein
MERPDERVRASSQETCLMMYYAHNPSRKGSEQPEDIYTINLFCIFWLISMHAR